MLNTCQFFTQAKHLLKTGKLSHNRKKFGQAGVNTLIIKVKVRNMFGVRLVQFTEALGWYIRYGIGPVGGY